MIQESLEEAQTDADFEGGAGLDASQSPRRRTWRRLLWFGGAALLLIVLAGLPILVRLRSPAPVPIPADVGGLPLTAHAFGKQAAEHIAHLHGKGFLLTGAAVGEYGNGQATIWVSQTVGRLGAQAQIRAMTGSIAGGTSPFTPTGQRAVRGCGVYALTGMGQTHFYFSVADRVIWLAVAPGQAEATLQEVVDYYAPLSGSAGC